MRFCLHDLEKLYHRGADGHNGNIVKAFGDSKILSVNIIYRNRAVAHTFQYSLLKSFLESIKKSQIEITRPFPAALCTEASR